MLSVCSTQYKTVLDALRGRKERFIFEEVEIPLSASVMAFITMNPGYPGRAELPESLKALFRPVSMVVPDLGLICEIMLMAEGFQDSKLLSRKFVVLYKLCEDLLSKSVSGDASAGYTWKRLPPVPHPTRSVHASSEWHACYVCCAGRAV